MPDDTTPETSKKPEAAPEEKSDNKPGAQPPALPKKKGIKIDEKGANNTDFWAVAMMQQIGDTMRPLVSNAMEFMAKKTTEYAVKGLGRLAGYSAEDVNKTAESWSKKAGDAAKFAYGDDALYKSGKGILGAARSAVGTMISGASAAVEGLGKAQVGEKKVNAEYNNFLGTLNESQSKNARDYFDSLTKPGQKKELLGLIAEGKVPENDPAFRSKLEPDQMKKLDHYLDSLTGEQINQRNKALSAAGQVQAVPVTEPLAAASPAPAAASPAPAAAVNAGMFNASGNSNNTQNTKQPVAPPQPQANEFKPEGKSTDPFAPIAPDAFSDAPNLKHDSSSNTGATTATSAKANSSRERAWDSNKEGRLDPEETKKFNDEKKELFSKKSASSIISSSNSDRNVNLNSAFQQPNIVEDAASNTVFLPQVPTHPVILDKNKPDEPGQPGNGAAVTPPPNTQEGYKGISNTATGTQAGSQADVPATLATPHGPISYGAEKDIDNKVDPSTVTSSEGTEPSNNQASPAAAQETNKDKGDCDAEVYKAFGNVLQELEKKLKDTGDTAAEAKNEGGSQVEEVEEVKEVKEEVVKQSEGDETGVGIVKAWSRLKEEGVDEKETSADPNNNEDENDKKIHV